MATGTLRTGMNMADLQDLAPLAKKLNEKTDEFSNYLEAIQTTINSFSLGVEAWLNNYELSRELTYRDDQDPRAADQRTVHVKELGYGRFGDEWAILVRQMEYTEAKEYRSGVGEWDFEEGSLHELSRKPLLRSSRGTRVRAVELIPKLIDALRDEATRVIEAVEQARKIAESLT